MNTDLMNRILALAWMVGAILCGAATIAGLVYLIVVPAWITLGITVLMGCLTVGFGVATVGFGKQLEERTVFTNAAEREVLNNRQRRELRRARGEVVMQRALIDVENERDNIVHRQIEAANDPNKPPHQTPWSEQPRRIGKEGRGW